MIQTGNPDMRKADVENVTELITKWMKKSVLQGLFDFDKLNNVMQENFRFIQNVKDPDLQKTFTDSVLNSITKGKVRVINA